MRVLCIEGAYRLRQGYFLVDANYLSSIVIQAVSAPKLQDESSKHLSAATGLNTHVRAGIHM